MTRAKKSTKNCLTEVSSAGIRVAQIVFLDSFCHMPEGGLKHDGLLFDGKKIHIAQNKTVFLHLKCQGQAAISLSFYLENNACLHLNHESIGHQEIKADFHLQEGSILYGLVQTRGDNTHVFYHLFFEEPNAECIFYGFMSLNQGQKNTQTYTLLHKKPHCHSSVYFKNILDDKAQGIFESHVTVDKYAEKSEAFQEAHSLILSEQARQLSKPELRIYNEDVVCKHGATIGALSEIELFYLMCRSLCQKRARQLLIEAFFKDLTDKIQLVSPYLSACLHI